MDAETTGPLAIEVSGLTHRFGERVAIDRLDLRVPAGQVLGVVGPNGAGKSTLFRCLVGLLRPAAGSVRVLDAPAGDRAARAQIGYVTQSEALYGDLSVAANVRFFGEIYGLKGAALDAAVASALRDVELTDRATSRVRTLSGGMRRRVSLASAVVHRPRLVLLDEPTAGVDPELRLRFWDMFARWTAEGATLIISTHHLEETRRCDRLLFLRAGRLIADGTPAGLAAEVGADGLEEAFLRWSRRDAEARP